MAPAGTSADPTQGAPAGAPPSPLRAGDAPGLADVMDTGEPLVTEIPVGHAPSGRRSPRTAGTSM